MMSRMVGEDQTVIAQNYALGISVLGFILYPVLNRAVHERFKALLTFSTVLVSIICIFLIQQHISYAITLTAGLILFFLMGLFRQFGSLFGCLYHPWGANTGPAGGFCLGGRYSSGNISITT